MDTLSDRTPQHRSWWLALAALAVCSPWPGWAPPWPSVLAFCVVLVAFARPRGWAWSPWLAVILSLTAVLGIGPGAEIDNQHMQEALAGHCRSMLGTAEGIAQDPGLAQLYQASGEITDPAMPFRLLESRVAAAPGRTAYLADDRGLVVAWGGRKSAFPSGVRPLGPRRWGLVWSAGGVVLYLREPIILEGRLVGAVTVADRSDLLTSRAFGMRAPRGASLTLGSTAPGAVTIDPRSPPGVRVPLAVGAADPSLGSVMVWLPWLLFVGLAVLRQPIVAMAAVAVGGLAIASTGSVASGLALASGLLLGAAAVGRTARQIGGRWARALIVTTVVLAGAFTLIVHRPEIASWLPRHLLQPGWGGVWMVAMAWCLAGWPSLAGQSFSLARRLGLSAILAAVAVVLAMVRLPVELVRADGGATEAELPGETIDLAEVLPVEPDRCDLSDLTSILAGRWNLDRWTTPSELRLLDRYGLEISRWGDLGRVGDEVRLARSWVLPELKDAAIELRVAEQPWSFIHDWRDRPVRGRPSPVWFAALTRSGEVAATLNAGLRAVDPMTAGELFHAGGGWSLLEVGELRRLALVRRQGEWLVAGVARYPAPSDWVVHAAMACLWALFGFVVARPPSFRMEQLATFGGRLRLLVAGGVVLPLVVLTPFLHLRFEGERHQREQAMGLETLRAARYAATHLGGGFAVDDDLARWIASGWGGEVVVFDGAEVLATSRPDYMKLGFLPELPATEGFISYLLGRDDPVVLRHGDELAAAGAVELGGRRLLLQLFRPNQGDGAEVPWAVDWLITGAILAALLALVLTSRVERRLSVSLRDLVSVARKLLQREPVLQMRSPPETDLAEVLSAVRSMSEEVQRRELSLRHQEELLRITLSTLAQAVVVLERGGEIRFANQSAERLRAEHGEIMFREIEEAGGRCEALGKPVVETVAPLPGQELTWRIGVAETPLPDGRRGLVAVIDDVSDVVRADRLRQLTQLARIVAHEVKNPLTPIRLWVQELEEARRARSGDLEGLLEEACGEISTQVERLQDMANSFSNLVALEHWEPVDVDLVQLVRDSVSHLAVLERRGVNVKLDEPESADLRVMGDPQWLRRAVDNLLLNSVAAIGEHDGEVLIAVNREGETAVLEVEDTGGGVPDEQLEDLFSPQFSTTSGGSGLGLALVHNVVHRCQGAVSARNGAAGLRVRLEFPVTMTS